MSIFDNIFGNKQQQQSAPANQSDPATGAAAAATNPTVPSAATMPPATGTESPLSKYNTLWDNTGVVDNTPAPFEFNADPAKLMDAAKSVDFTKAITPDLQKRINAGGADAQVAMMEAMNTVSQMTYAQSSLAASKIAEAAQRAAEDRFKAMIPDLLRNHSVQDNIRTTNPFVNDPAMKPLISGLQEQFARKYPQATATEISTHVSEYLDAAADRITGNRPKPVDKAARPEQDWSTFL
jgi:hypothetical protein